MSCCFSWLQPAKVCINEKLENGVRSSTVTQFSSSSDLEPDMPLLKRSLSGRKRCQTVSAGFLPNAAPETAIVALSDPGQDLDDEMAFIMMRYLVERGHIDLRGVVTTLAPAYDRARLCRGTLNLLGLHRVPVGVGTDGGDTQAKHTAAPFEEGAKSYMPARNAEEAMLFEPGRRLLNRVYKDAEPLSLTLLIIASLKDAALFLRDNEMLFVQKTKEVVVMGGCEIPEAGNYLEIDQSHNLQFDKDASIFFYRRCQELGVRLILISRFAAYAAPMPRDTYDKLAVSGSSIGRRLRNAQRDSLEQLWRRATAAPDDARRMGLPGRCDRSWFMKTFCAGQDDGRSWEQPVWDLVKNFNQYDTVALFATVPDLRQRFFNPTKFSTKSLEGRKVENLLIGVKEGESNVVDPASDMVAFLQEGFEAGMAFNHHFKAQIVLIAELRSDTITDLVSMAVMLRSLYEMETVHCLGVVLVHSQESNASSPRLAEQSNKIREMLNLTGLRFVPLFYVHSATEAVQNMKELYLQALPTGVTLVVSATLTVAATFVDMEPALYCERTARVVLMGGVRRREYASQWLEPDPDATNNRLDIDAAKRFYHKSQELSVSMTIVSRFAARAGSVPRATCDVLASHGGEIGRFLCDTCKQGFVDLWKQACENEGSPNRGSLPTRCDRHWFLSTFCAGRQPADDGDIWNQIVSFNAYSPLALLFALPGVVKKYVNATEIQVRAASHQVIGWSADEICVPNPKTLQKLIVHCLIYGARCNVSEYMLGSIPPIRIGIEDVSKYELDMSEDALIDMIPQRSAFL
mmetsp:Transcript_118612/g.187848  ORF Transcript_118612/g.187848 Transcript_118612/m.187848 type:complete len:802 (-) Transcript_118612:145-2550(-)